MSSSIRRCAFIRAWCSGLPYAFSRYCPTNWGFHCATWRRFRCSVATAKSEDGTLKAERQDCNLVPALLLKEVGDAFPSCHVDTIDGKVCALVFQARAGRNTRAAHASG